MLAYLTSIVLTATLLSPVASASPPPVEELSNGTLAPPHFDYGLDTDGDTLYNYLVVDVNVSVTVPGMFIVGARLSDTIGGTDIDIQNNFTNLGTGAQTVPIWFNGIAIRSSGFNGPYAVTIILLNDTMAMQDMGFHFTAPYLSTQFQQPPAWFEPPHSDFGEDTDGDSFFNNLVLQTVLNATDSGVYMINADLFDATGMMMITSTSWGGALGTGIQMVELRFEGFQIFMSGIDGPYMIDLRLYDSMGLFLDNDTHMTQPYLYTDFEPTGGAVLYPPYSDYGVDTDGDSLFNYLVVEIPINVSETNFYDVNGNLFDNSGMFSISYQSNMSNFMPGIWTIQLWFTGYEIRNSGFDGPYMLQIDLTRMGFPLDSDTYMTNSYLYTDFDEVPAKFEPPHSDFGVDLDADMLYDYLVVNVTLNVSEAGPFRVEGDLFDSSMSVYIISAFNETVLGTGIQVMQLWFPGFPIRSSGIDGPYLASLSLYYVGTGAYLSSDTHLTGAYLYIDFETPPLFFNPPHSDYGLDTDGDTMYNHLVVDVNVMVNTSGDFEFQAILTDITGMSMIDMQSNITYLGAGPGTVEIRFDGMLIRQSGFDGPYRVDLTAIQARAIVDTDVYITGPYLYTDFQSPPAEFGAPHSDYGLDTDVPPDGYFNFLVVNATVEVYRAGNYLVQGVLTHAMIPSGIATVNMTYLDVGTQIVQLRFSGKSIYASGASGTFTVFMILATLDASGGTMLDMDIYMTTSYLNSDFQPTNPGMLWGYVLEAGTGIPISGAQVNAFNFTDRFFTSTSADVTGYYSMPLYEGDFFVAADGPMPVYQAEGQLVFVSGATEASFDLGPVPPNTVSNSLVFSDWDNVNVTASMSLQQDNQTNRAMIDVLLGNSDGYLSGAEIEMFIALMGVSPSMPGSTQDMFYVDAIYYDLVPGSEGMHADDGGAVWNDAPMTLNLMGDYVSNSPIPGGTTHNVRANVTLDTASEENILFVDIPASFYLLSYDPVPDVNVGGVGTRNIVVDPLANASAPSPYVWVNMTVQMSADSTAPEITGVMIDGQPSVTYYLSSLPASAQLTATVDDSATGNSIIGGANYTTPSATSWPGTSMSAGDGAFDSPTEDVTASVPVPATPGTYRYYVHAWDAVFNRNDTAPYATIIVIDDLPPEISNVLVDGQASATYYLSSLPANVVLTALVDDTLSGGLIIGGANYTTPTATTWPGSPMSASDGAFDEQSEAVTATIPTPSTPGTHRYYVHAWDSQPSYNNTAPYATVIIIDDLAPEITLVRVNGLTSVTVNAGTSVILNASTSDAANGGSNIGGANYTIGLAQWPGTPMAASDGAFNSPQEDVTASIDTTGWTVGTYQVCVYAWDTAQGYDDSVQACAQIDIVIDSEPPSISQVRLEAQTSVTVRPGTDVLLTAVISDIATGGSDIAGANYTDGMAQWPGTAMAASDGAFDSSQESVSVTIDTTGWTDGAHSICVYGWDSSGFRNTTAQECANIIIDGTAPAISQVTATPDPQQTGLMVEISAAVTDSGGVSAVSVEVRGPGGTLIGNYSMVYDSGTQKYEYSTTFNTVGTYTFNIWASDVVGNYAHASGDFEITQPVQPPQPSFIEQYWWALLIVIIVVVALLVFLLIRKKKPAPALEGEEVPPAEQPPAETPPLEAPPPPAEEATPPQAEPPLQPPP